MKIRLTALDGTGTRVTFNWPNERLADVLVRWRTRIPLGTVEFRPTVRDEKLGVWLRPRPEDGDNGGNREPYVRLRNDGFRVHVVDASLPPALMGVFGDLATCR